MKTGKQYFQVYALCPASRRNSRALIVAMNIFVLDNDLSRCAAFHADQHVGKMILESAQMLCTTLNMNGIEAPYRSTHVSHPCRLWVGKTLANWLWLRNLGLALNEEFRFRFGHERDHQAATVIRDLPVPSLSDGPLTEFAQAMPEKYKVPGDAVKAYRRFYIAEKSRFATWTRRSVPDWFKTGRS